MSLGAVCRAVHLSRLFKFGLEHSNEAAPESRPMGARYLLALAAACAAVDVAYFRDDPAAKTHLNVTEDGAAWLQSHDTTIEIFDSPKPVHV